MTSAQIFAVDALLDNDILTQFAHHGDCIGADVDFHKISRVQGLSVIGHPPIKTNLRAYCEFDEVREPKEFIIRNHDIVNESNWMIFTPSGFIEILRSGTWSTVRYAKYKNKEGHIIWPDGIIETLEEWESVL